MKNDTKKTGMAKTIENTNPPITTVLLNLVSGTTGRLYKSVQNSLRKVASSKRAYPIP